ncbi:MAG: hypothetical protein IPL32_15150 [Chloracidobacterium sp.]|nr:hypothetical protein [Chloracidobacterium sp.]
MSRPQHEYEMPEDYKKNLVHLTEFLEAREGYRAQIKEGVARGVHVSPADKATVDEQLREFDRIIDGLEKGLAEEYDRYKAEKAREAEMSASVDRAWEASKRLYISIKHQKPHLLEKFTETVLGPMPIETREEFLDSVAILEATKLDAILKGEDD